MENRCVLSLLTQFIGNKFMKEDSIRDRIMNCIDDLNEARYSTFTGDKDKVIEKVRDELIQMTTDLSRFTKEMDNILNKLW